jgi:pyruvate-formate lyase-activating enzyme
MNAKKISFLPYHEGGRFKNEQLGRPDPMPEAKAPGDDHALTLKHITEKDGLEVTIGN